MCQESLDLRGSEVQWIQMNIIQDKQRVFYV